MTDQDRNATSESTSTSQGAVKREPHQNPAEEAKGVREYAKHIVQALCEGRGA